MNQKMTKDKFTTIRISIKAKKKAEQLKEKIQKKYDCTTITLGDALEYALDNKLREK